MGLDQYMRLDRLDGSEHEHMFTWRKHPDLHGFMTVEWLALPENSEKTSMNFNCEQLDMTIDILDRLDACIHPTSPTTALPETTGFFFGASDGRYDDQDRKALEFARGALADGHRIYYSSWW